jgi:hypothetical protein
MARMTININQPNVEQIELTAQEVNSWVDDVKINGVQTTLETALDEAQADVMNGSSEIQYVLIKITL